MKKKKRAKIKIIIIAALALLLIFCAVFAGILAPHDPSTPNAAAIRMAPCAEYPLGTDNLGRCVLSRVLYGGRITIAATFLLVLVSFVVGTLIGIFSGYYGGLLDKFLMRLADVFLAFPQMVIAIAVLSISVALLVGATNNPFIYTRF